MLAVPLIIAPIAFAGGLYLAARLAPDRGDAPAARRAGRVIDVLVGAAATAFALNVYLAVRGATADIYEGFDRGDTVAQYLAEALWQGGLLLGLAALVQLVAARAERP
jgi:hypothetical protein